MLITTQFSPDPMNSTSSHHDLSQTKHVAAKLHLLNDTNKSTAVPTPLVNLRIGNQATIPGPNPSGNAKLGRVN
jgi:hypothetical protein